MIIILYYSFAISYIILKIVLWYVFDFSMQVLRAHGLPELCRARLQGERHVFTWKGLGTGKTHPSLARRQSSQQFEMRCLQEKLFHCRVPFRVSLRVVRHDGNSSPS